MTSLPAKRVTLPGHRLHERLNTLTITHAALCCALAVHNRSKAIFAPGENVAMGCIQLDVDVLAPLNGPIEAALHGAIPKVIEIGFVPRRLPPGLLYAPWATGIQHAPWYNSDTFKAPMFGVLTPVFVEFYESYAQWLSDGRGKQDNWPEIWRFANVVRNAISHNGIDIRSKTERAVTWRGLSYSKLDDRKQIVGTDLGLGDFFVLMFEMSDELDALGCAL